MAKKRLIDANWILREIEHDVGCYELEKLTPGGVMFVELRDVVKLVCAAPTVDAAEVVRCKDCKDHKACEIEDLLVFIDPNAEHYCCHGERKDDA